MDATSFYTPRLSAGLGLVPETGRLLELWQPGMTPPDLLKAAMDSGAFPSMSARRLRNVVAEAFAPRFLTEDGGPARFLKALQGRIAAADFRHLLLVYTCRANPVLADFIRDVYWARYAAGLDIVLKDDAHAFISRAVADGRTRARWSDTTILRVSQYVLGACADFGLVGPMRGAGRVILPFRITPIVASFLAHDLHFRGLGDNSVVQHPDWMLFGLYPEDTLGEMKRLAMKGQFILQSAGGMAHIAWKLKSMEELPDVLAAG
ncbi:BrxA family protein [Roseomonas genomospecies 6]|uniref:DUF1819 family protein n=1 Tax=Roseomonas genomospecies 6 TaxID=214106 RepID=A0A9W7KPS6_9PROT|nr:BrxA family protein [Roseomonas genomospecies 6]KAA0676974.1 DUF1819 family protein [Roseomonas genomospecies 6]